MAIYKIRKATADDLGAMTHLFRETVQQINAVDYTPAQIDAWLAKATAARWRELFGSDLCFFVAEQQESLVGFASINASGHLHSLFVHATHLRHGIASALLRTAIRYALDHGAERMTSEVSVTARPFFDQAGFTLRETQRVCIGGEELTNYVMELPLTLHLRLAEQADVPRILEIIRQAQAQMRVRGSLQWQNGYPAPKNIESDIQHAYGYVLCDAKHVIAYAAVVFDGEPAYEQLTGKWLSEGAYVVVHRLAVADEMKGRGVATEFMRRIEALALRLGTPAFRVDTNFDNSPMLRVLDRLGFVHCGEISYEGAPRLAFEKLLK